MDSQGGTDTHNYHLLLVHWLTADSGYGFEMEVSRDEANRDAPRFLSKLTKKSEPISSLLSRNQFQLYGYMQIPSSRSLLSHPLLPILTQAAVPWESIWEMCKHRWQSKALDPHNPASPNVKAGEILPSLWQVIVTLSCSWKQILWQLNL